MDLKICVVFSHGSSDEITWPYKGYDYEGRKKELMEKLKDRHPDIKFKVLSAKNPDEAEEILDKEEEFDAFLVCMIGMWTGVPIKISKSEKPVLLADDLYGGSGEFLLSYEAAKEKGKVVPSTSFEDISEMLSLLKAMKRMENSRILAVKQEEPKFGFWGKVKRTEELPPQKYSFEEYSAKIKKTFGTKIVEMKPEKIKQYKKDSSEQKAKKLADEWTKRAREVIEPSREDVVDSAKFYLALKRAMKEKNVDAITVDCFDFFQSGIPIGYPCLAYFELNNNGSIGICEADLSSAITQMLCQYMIKELTGEPRPGYVSDPVIDQNLKRITYAHCVAPSKVYGPNGPENPFIIRSHSESREGASIQSLMPMEEKVTTVIIDVPNRKMRIHEAKTIENLQEEKGCRTKLSAKAEVKNILENWRKSGWHRVTFYGEWKDQLKKLASLIGLEVLEEDHE